MQTTGAMAQDVAEPPAFVAAVVRTQRWLAPLQLSDSVSLDLQPLTNPLGVARTQPLLPALDGACVLGDLLLELAQTLLGIAPFLVDRQQFQAFDTLKATSEPLRARRLPWGVRCRVVCRRVRPPSPPASVRGPARIAGRPRPLAGDPGAERIWGP